jgi:hypothetical protein
LATYATTDYVLMIDDDLKPKSDRFLEIAITALENEPLAETIVGAEGVALGTDCSYRPTGRSGGPGWEDTVHFKNVSEDVRVDVVKGRCLIVRTEALRGLPMYSADREVCDDIAVSGLLTNGRHRPHLVSAAFGACLDDIEDVEAGVALSRRSDWREMRQIAADHYFNPQADPGVGLCPSKAAPRRISRVLR